MIQKFIKQFTEKEIKGIVKIRNEFYLADEELKKISDKIDLEPFSLGIYLGKNKGKNFEPSLPLLELLSELSEKKLFINKNSEWLFLCGRDLFGKGIVGSNTEKGLALVQSEEDENLGYGKIIGDLSEKERVVVKNILDKGDYLRRES